MTRFYADLHIHSRYSRATSRACDLEHLSAWAQRKGITLLGTGDITHPAWRQELREKLEPAEPGLYRLRADLQKEVERATPTGLRAETRFILQGEISTIYKRGGRTRKVHHIVFAPSLDGAERLAAALGRIGNLVADGRPILGLDSRDLLEIVLQAEDGAFLVPAHVWTPWFSLFGSMSGFESVEECYADLSSHIFALETGLSSDPPMNWRLSALDRYRLVSNSDTHSPQKIGREACVFAVALDFFAIRGALQTGEGYGGTIEFFPEEGKYHLDGHRKCNLRWTPEETRRHQGICAVCGQPVTIGVMHRVEELADRPAGSKPPQAAPYTSLIPLGEILAEIHDCREASKGVQNSYQRLLTALGPEIFILQDAPLDEIAHRSSDILAEAISRMRESRVMREAGYDGEYGVIRLFDDGEIARLRHGGALFTMPTADATAVAPQPAGVSPKRKQRSANAAESAPGGSAAVFDADQRAAIEHGTGPLLIVAGPGSGKTHTLTNRLSQLVRTGITKAADCLAITFTRRAAAEMASRLAHLLGKVAEEAMVTTFHGLGLHILREQAGKIGLPLELSVADEEERRQAAIAAGVKPAEAERWLERISRAKRSESQGDEARAVEAYDCFLRASGLMDFDDLILLPLHLLEKDEALRCHYRQRWPWIFVDELQDIDPAQYRLLRCLAPADGNICAIGDPDQAIYGFRGSDVRLFARFQEDFPACRVIVLQRNYRSTPAIVAAAMQAIAPATLVGDRQLSAVRREELPIFIKDCATDKAEAEFVVETIESLLGGHSFFSIDSGRGQGRETKFSFGDFAVLYRTAAQAEAFGEALSRAGIPYQCHSHAPLRDHPLVQAILAHLTNNAGGKSLGESLLAAADSLPKDNRAQARAWATALLPLVERCGGDLSRLRSEMALLNDNDLLDPRAEQVSLLTLHAAKGLEFRVVFLVGCEDGLLPLYFGDAPEDLAEERRLFFVGLTRARDRLILTYAHKRLWRGRVREMAISSFLADIEEKLLSHMESARRRNRKYTRQMSLFGQ